MSFHPLKDFVLIRRAEPKAVTKGGVLLPDHVVAMYAGAPREGCVEAVGPECVGMNLVGALVIYSSSSATPIQIDGELRDVVRVEEIIGTIALDQNVAAA